MRIWTIHPKYIDVKGFVALWRETLLAQNVLKGTTKAWSNHPQLLPFKTQLNPVAHISNYLHHVAIEARARQYQFAEDKIALPYNNHLSLIPTTREMLIHEWLICLDRYRTRSPKWYEQVKNVSPFTIEAHPSYVVSTFTVSKRTGINLK